MYICSAISCSKPSQQAVLHCFAVICFSHLSIMSGLILKAFVLCALLELSCAARITTADGTAESSRRVYRGAEWLNKLQVKLHAGANRTTLPRLPRAWRDRFEMVKKLGEGGFGAVYQLRVTCADTLWSSTWLFSATPNSYVSAKLVTGQDMEMKMMKKEIERMRLFWSDYVVSTVGKPDTAKSADGLWVMMPFLNGGSMIDLVKRCAESEQCQCMSSDHPWACWDAIGLSLNYILALFDDALMGLEDILNFGMVHLDMKPANIMLQCSPGGAESCSAIVIDLGTLHNINENRTSLAGTPGFLAPEAYPDYGGHNGIPANDVWAMGVTLYQLLYMDFPDFIGFWGPDIKAQAKYNGDEDNNIPKAPKRTDIDQLVVDMMNPNYTQRITLSQARHRVRSFIEARKPTKEILDHLWKTPTERGIKDKLPPCIDQPTAAEQQEDLEVDLGALIAGTGTSESLSDQPCRTKVSPAEGMFKCGLCNGILCQRCCECYVNYHGQLQPKYFRAKSCE